MGKLLEEALAFQLKNKWLPGAATFVMVAVFFLIGPEAGAVLPYTCGFLKFISINVLYK